MRMLGPTIDRKEIRKWADENNARPCEVLPFIFDGEAAVLRFLVGGPSEGTSELRPISWESFFAQFELLGLVFMYEPGRPGYEILQIEKKTASNVEMRPN